MTPRLRETGVSTVKISTLWIILALVIGACSSSAGRAASTTSIARHSPRRVSSPIAPRCQIGQLRAGPPRSTVGMGHVTTVFIITNRSGRTCTLHGYPRVVLFDRNGLFPTHQTNLNITSSDGNPVPVQTVSIPPEGAASFEVFYSDSTGYATAVCPAADQVEITPPGDSSAIRVDWGVQPYGGATIQQLQCGDLVISAIQPGSQLSSSVSHIDA